jgi:nucleoside-diphosphate-sugar epimerase
MKVLLLGSNGFIGKALSTKINSTCELISVSRETNLEDLFKSKQIFDFIINCASSSPSAGSEESFESNFLYPSQFFKNVLSKNWIQIESYFQLQIPSGRLDPYTIEKEKFSNFLDVEGRSPGAPVVYHLCLPHVFGEGDRSGRLISSAIASFKVGKEFEISSGDQFLPILHISDAVEGILRFMENPTSDAACAPFWYGTVRELLELISKEFTNTRVMYSQKLDPVDAGFPPVEFSECVAGWQPKMQLNEFLEWVREQNG